MADHDTSSFYCRHFKAPDSTVRLDGPHYFQGTECEPSPQAGYTAEEMRAAILGIVAGSGIVIIEARNESIQLCQARSSFSVKCT